MDYKTLDGHSVSINGDLEFSMVSIIIEDVFNKGRPENICTISQSIDVADVEKALPEVKKIVASMPPFLVSSELPWMLSYIDAIESHFLNNYVSHGSDYVLTGKSIYDMAEQFAYDTDAISATRMFFAIDLISHVMSNRRLYGHDYFLGDDNFLDQFDRAVKVLFFQKDIYSRAFSDYGVVDKSFKTKMTKGIYKDSVVIVSIPDGEELQSYRNGDKTMILNSGSAFVAKIIRFYKTDLCWANRATFEFYPRMVGMNRLRIPDEPMFAVEMEMAQGVASSMGWGVTINAFIPMHWVTHIKAEGQFKYTRDSPIASKGVSTNLPALITREQFERNGWV
jgi:hypothetical protein